MQIIKGPELSKRILDASVITIGNFDGVHRGHAEIFRHLKQQSEQLGYPSVVVTFEPHPVAVLAPASAPPRITTSAQKAALIAEAGIDYLVIIDFTPDFSQVTAEAFVVDILCDLLGLKHIIIGHDYAFGKDRRGDFETLARLGTEHGFTLEDLDPVGQEGMIFSSSLARRFVAEGDMTAAAVILGRYHSIAGEVVHGRQIGAKIGFPTANIATYNEMIPPDGVYSVAVAVDDNILQGACSIGTNPTFGEGERSIEVFLLDYKGELYGHDIALCFVQRLRGVKKFYDVEELIRTIEQDIATTREVLASADKALIKPLVAFEHSHD